MRQGEVANPVSHDTTLKSIFILARPIFNSSFFMRNDDVGAHIASLALSPLNLVLKESRQCIKNVIVSVANSVADRVCEI